MSDLIQQIDSNNNGDFICGVVEGFYGKPWTFEQRHDLFKRLKDMKLNSFMYAPKDDTKHRAKWRTLYSDIEAKKMRSLIEEAKLNGIDFYYSLAPGLDMVYSDQEEIDCLISKYDQLVELGCQCFAILFDDIEPTITNDKDGQVFKNYASAQVSVTNLIFEHLDKPKFLFCPTEYCESRAVPDVLNSFYLNTIGSGLHEGIDIMWSGSRVISRLITDESIDRLSRVIRRAPVIWENLHANDYDKRRIFMGPYSGRTTSIISKLKGVLTNPNCEYEANHIAIHTLAQWSRCTNDINENNQCDLKRRSSIDMLLHSSEDDDSYDKTVYDPHRALMLAIKSWLPRVLEDKPCPADVAEFVINHLGQQGQVNLKRDDQQACAELIKSQQEPITSDDNINNVVEMISDDLTQSSEASCDSTKIQMDTTNCANINGSTIEPSSNSCDSCEMQDESQDKDATDDSTEKAGLNLSSSKEANNSETMDYVASLHKTLEEKFNLEETSYKQSEISLTDLSLLVELFYLPFEHGSLGTNLLKDLRWLRNNCDLILNSETIFEENIASKKSSTETKRTRNLNVDGETRSLTNDEDSSNDSGESVDSKSPEIWRSRADKLNLLCNSIVKSIQTIICNCPNKPLLVELYPYLVDLRDTTVLLNDYLRFLRCRSSDGESFNDERQKFKLRPETDVAASINDKDEQEPWVHRGGLMGDIYRIIYQ